ncbi:hypothetical protein MHYP_G00041670 [Metynnis hypsauchen]
MWTLKSFMLCLLLKESHYVRRVCCDTLECTNEVIECLLKLFPSTSGRWNFKCLNLLSCDMSLVLDSLSEVHQKGLDKRRRQH